MARRKTELQKRYDTEARCLEYLREFVEKCKAEGLTFGDNGYLSVGISNDMISLDIAVFDAPEEAQTDCWADPRQKKMRVTHLSHRPSGNPRIDVI